MDIRNVGGTPGGTKTFLLGIVMAVLGGYLFLQQVSVNGGFWHWSGLGGYGKSFGVTLIPLLLGVGILFFNGRSLVGWVLTVGTALVIVAGIIANMDLHFRHTSLWNTLVILVLLVGGIGLVARAVLPMDRAQPDRRDDRDAA